VSVLAIELLIRSELPFFSSIGPSYDQRVKPDVMAQGVSTVLSNQFGDIVTANGTSFLACQQVWLFWQAPPTKTNKEMSINY
jgi:hypothetical protein